MRDNFSANNSSNVAQGRDNKALMKGSTVNIGASLTERVDRVNSLSDLEQAIKSDGPLNAEKEAAIRHVQNAKEELETSREPNADDVGKWLGRAATTLKAAEAGAGLIDKMHKVLTDFGISL